MGAIHFSLDQELVDFAIDLLGVDTFIESGTFRGDTTFAVKGKFREIHSIELSEPLFNEAVNRFKEFSHIKMYRGDSGQMIRKIASENDLSQRKIFFWLDAHWCEASSVSGVAAQCPLLAELSAIKKLSEESIVVIDDARLFLAPPSGHDRYSAQHWPRLQQVIDALSALSLKHEILVSNDVVIFFPQKIRDEVFDFYATKGCDWLTIADKARDYDGFPKVLDKFREERDRDAKAREQFYAGKLVEMQLGFLRHLRALDADKRADKKSRTTIWINKVLNKLTSNESPVALPPDLTLSIIVPIIEAAHLVHLNSFLLSIQMQDYKNIEILMVDVTKEDKAKEVCEAFSKADSRFRYFHEDLTEFDDVANLGLFRSSGYFFICSFPVKEFSSHQAVGKMLDQVGPVRQQSSFVMGAIVENVFSLDCEDSQQGGERTNLLMRGDPQFYSAQSALVFIRQNVYDIGGFDHLAKNRELEDLYLRFLGKGLRFGRVRV